MKFPCADKISNNFFKKKNTIYLRKEREDRERPTFHLLIHSPDTYSHPGWTSVKPGARGAGWVAAQGLKQVPTILCCLPRYWKDAGPETESAWIPTMLSVGLSNC